MRAALHPGLPLGREPGGANCRRRDYFRPGLCAFANVAITADDATTFRWAAHAIWNACTHSRGRAT